MIVLYYGITPATNRCHLFMAELPYGWERIDDPKYGTYYIE